MHHLITYIPYISSEKYAIYKDSQKILRKGYFDIYVIHIYTFIWFT